LIGLIVNYPMSVLSQLSPMSVLSQLSVLSALSVLSPLSPDVHTVFPLSLIAIIE